MATAKSVPLKEAKSTPVTKEVKLLPSEKRALKRREAAEKATQIFGTGKGSTEPTINALSYTIDLMRALNYYNSAYDSKTKRKWVMAYIGKGSESTYSALSDYHFTSVGTVIRLKSRGQYLEDRELTFIDTKLAELKELATQGKQVSSLKGGNVPAKAATPVVSVQDRVKDLTSTHIAEINAMIDEYILNDVEFDVSAYLKGNEVSAAVTKLIPPAFDKMAAELKEAIKGDDKQLVEGYSNFKKVKLRKFLKLIESIKDACEQQVVTVKSVRKPTVRIPKVKSPTVLASKVKFMRESTDLGVKSVLPVNIVGASEVWIYNTKYKKLQVYRAFSKSALSIKGTTIVDYEVATSDCKSLRKPELLKSYVSMNKTALAKTYNALTTKVAVVNGRINEDCIILKVFA
jgi:hypothetical protein